ncbi:anthranilate synthase component II [Nocardioides jiangxiensis]|uniref:Aminodeoxychorismate/anthranilate synthase component II n=1 Tax=Nocardioides jiangxiensis TaxID=3064524 RepID=A0ABT9B0K7_9ACTN|nr:aminodeoxychorismate/anthranilate synthase component II [Nocardioides sp. WY-20]MDO7868392.1 aminodeoxychorismate/anthranilate synthase component II [Nocardioides sp. WY-20]
MLVDHHDSYTWNLAHLIASVTGELPDVVAHDSVGVSELEGYSHLVLSPGPGSPHNRAFFDLGRTLILEDPRPLLGVCLGMQGLVTAYGGHVGRTTPAHGEVASVVHDGSALFAGVPTPFAAVRYHSLEALEMPDELTVTAACQAHDGSSVVMAVAHRTKPQVGVQFHPESILSEYGANIVRNFLELR